MMPGISNSTNVYDDDDLNDWEDDYQDLTMTVDIQQVEIADSWDKESIVSPRDFIEEEGEAHDAHPKPAQDAMNVHQVEMEQSVDTTNSEEEEEDESIDQVEDIVNETMDEEISVASSILEYFHSCETFVECDPNNILVTDIKIRQLRSRCTISISIVRW